MDKTALYLVWRRGNINTYLEIELSEPKPIISVWFCSVEHVPAAKFHNLWVMKAIIETVLWDLWKAEYIFHSGCIDTPPLMYCIVNSKLRSNNYSRPYLAATSLIFHFLNWRTPYSCPGESVSFNQPLGKVRLVDSHQNLAFVRAEKRLFPIGI